MARSLSPALSTTESEALYAKLTVAAATFFLMLELAYFVMAPPLSWAMPSLDALNNAAIGRDFLNTWIGGHAAFTGGPAPWFDAATYNNALREITGHPDLAYYFWAYPPHLLLFTWPFGFIPYLPAYALWCVGGIALYLWAARSGGVSSKHMLFLAVAPGVAVNVFFGQNGFLTAALLIGGLANLDRRPTFSGILFGILTIKPQFGLLLPVMLVLTGRWRVIAAAAATTVVLVAATSIWFGPDIWLEYVRKVSPQQHWLLAYCGGLLVPMMSSVFVGGRILGLPLDVDWVLQGISSASAFAMVVWTFWRPRDPVLSLALLVTAIFLFSPYMLNYDMVVFGWVVALLHERTDNTLLDERLAIAVWALPVAMLLLAMARIPAAMIVLPAFAGRLVWRLAREERQRDGGQDAVLAAAPA